jgi:tRNA U34 5-carboxymethylaminomethyl modifying enzyme MnmG/GidA
MKRFTNGSLRMVDFVLTRAEFRLSLRPDNADLRLTPVGLNLGLVGTQRAASFATRRQGVEHVEAALDSVRGSTHAWRRQGINVSDDGNALSAADLMTRSDLTLEKVISRFAAVFFLLVFFFFAAAFFFLVHALLHSVLADGGQNRGFDSFKGFETC